MQQEEREKDELKKQQLYSNVIFSTKKMEKKSKWGDTIWNSENNT